MALQRPGDNVRVSLLNGETVEGTIEWIDGNGAWVKGVQRSRWVPLEALLASEGSGATEKKSA